LVLTRRKLFMLPTRHGLLFSVVLLAIFLASVNYNNGLAYGLTFLLTATALVSMLHTHRNLSGLEVKILPCGPVFAGDTAYFRVAIRNSGDYPRVAIWLFCEDHRQLVHIEPSMTLQTEVPVASFSRGYITCAPLRLSSAYPLGLQYTWSAPVIGDARAVVYPSPAGILPLPQNRSQARFSESGHSLDGDDFAGLREFVPGDPPGHIHWKATAAHQSLLTKQFAGEGTDEVWLGWDQAPGPTESRLSQMSKWVVAAEEAGVHYGLEMPGVQLEPGRGVLHYHRCLHTLGLWGLKEDRQ